MDVAAIEEVLAAGKLGEIPFPEFLEDFGPAIDLSDWEQLFTSSYREQLSKPLSARLTEVGVLAARWEPVGRKPEDPRLWQAYLVLTLSPSAASSLKLVHDIAVTMCMSFFYGLKGKELWIEYQVASSEAISSMQAILEQGKIGEMPFSTWLEYDYAREGVWQIVRALGVAGVSSVRWEETEWDRKYLRHVHWQSYVVATLPMSDFASPHGMPSDGLVYAVAGALRHPYKYVLKATDSGVEVWVPFTVNLPLNGRALELLEAKGISTLGLKAETPTFRSLIRTRCQSLLSAIRRTN